MSTGTCGVLPSATSAIVPLRPEGRKNPLFLIHGVDGEVSQFKTLVSHFAPDQPVYGIRSQALLADPVALTRVEDMAEYYLKQVQELRPSGPYDFLGFSFGSLVAFEMARKLVSQGASVGLVGMVDNRPMARHTRINNPDPRADHSARRRGRLSSHLAGLSNKQGFSYARKKLWAKYLRTIYTLLDSVHAPIPRVFRSAYDINWFAAVRYVPSPFPGRVTLFEASESVREGSASRLLWTRLAGGGLDTREIRGNHEDLLVEPNVTFLAIAVMDCLEMLRRSSGAADCS